MAELRTRVRAIKRNAFTYHKDWALNKGEEVEIDIPGSDTRIVIEEKGPHANGQKEVIVKFYGTWEFTHGQWSTHYD